MESWIPTPDALDAVGAVGTVLFIGFLIITGRLVPGKTHREALAAAHNQVSKAEDRADRWEQVALKALDATEALTDPVTVSARVLERLPNPSQEETD